MPIAAQSHYRLLTTQSEFNTLCQHLQTLEAIALDTEFVRTRTLQPLLGLIQVFDGQHTHLIDPVGLSDLTPFAEILTNPSVEKVLHACSEDLEVFLAHMQVTPAPIFDTQYAANLLGMGPTLGYARLVELECGIVLDKGESRTDWLARPLSEKQLHYAANDVVYLYQVYQKLSPQIIEKKLRDMLYQELGALAVKKTAQLPPDAAYLTFSNNWRLNDEQRYVLKKLAAWRLKLARERNIAINFVVKEAHLLAVATLLPKNKNQLSGLGLLPQEIRKHGDTLVGIVNQSLAHLRQSPEECLVPKVMRLNDLAQYKKVFGQLKQLCIKLAAENAVTPEVLASKKQLNQLLKWWWFDLEETSAQGILPDLLLGWRRAVFEQPLLELLGQPVRPI